MTALKQFDRLESSGLWRADPDAQRRNVIVSLGDATLTISDASGAALAHWSLPAIARLNPGETPAIYTPHPESPEDLELDDETLIAALEKVHAVIEKRRPHKGRLRHVLTAGFFISLTGLAVFWLPDALISYTVNVVPEATRDALGDRLATRIHRVAGRACTETLGVAALETLGRSILPGQSRRLLVLADATRPALHLPGGTILLSRKLVEDHNSPYVTAGFVLAEAERAQQTDPMHALLDHAGFMATVKLLTTGTLSDAHLDRYSEVLLTGNPAPVPTSDLLARFQAANLPISPYAFALDPTGETTLPLIEADPVPLSDATLPLSDGEWISLQGICSD